MPAESNIQAHKFLFISNVASYSCSIQYVGCCCGFRKWNVSSYKMSLEKSSKSHIFKWKLKGQKMIIKYIKFIFIFSLIPFMITSF